MDMEHLNVDLTAVSVVGTVFVTCAIIVATVLYFVHRARELRYKTIQLALEKGQPLPPALLEPRKRESDLSKGIKFSFIGVGLGLFFRLVKPDLWSIGLIVLFVGLGYIVAYAVTQRGETPLPPVS